MEIEQYLKSKGIVFSKNEEVYEIEGLRYLFLPERDKLFDTKFQLVLTEVESEAQIDRYMFAWGERYFYTTKSEEVQLKPLLYLTNLAEESLYSNLGVHGKYEILNGTRPYTDWVQKAKSLGMTALGICERGTLAGVIQFQTACKKEGIKPIIGSTVVVKLGVEFVNMKVYVKDKTGWHNLLMLNKIQNVDNATEVQRFCTAADLYKHSEGLLVVIPTNFDFKDLNVLEGVKDKYYQLDLTSYDNPKYDEQRLENIALYLKKYSNSLPSALIQDSYYLEPEDYKAKWLINKVSKKRQGNQSKDEYFKSFEDIHNQAEQLEFPVDYIYEALLGNRQIVDKCNFEVQTGKRYLPKYEMNTDEAELFTDNEALFWHKISFGLEEKIIKKFPDIDIQPYLDRIQKEVEVLKRGNIIDYFLILSDVSDWCDKNSVLRGTGRGSAGGSLISFLLNIIEADPLKYDLIFERFLSEARLFRTENTTLYKLTTEEGCFEYEKGSFVEVKRSGEILKIKIEEIKENDELCLNLR